MFQSAGIDCCFLLDSAGTIEIPVLRHGSDLSSLTSVWCATRPADPPSASPGVDYIPSSKKVEFKPGKTEEVSSEQLSAGGVSRVCRVQQRRPAQGGTSFQMFQHLLTVSVQTCSLTIMDDIQNPSIEGSESFVVFLSSPHGAVLQEPYEANVVITDTFQDSMCYLSGTSQNATNL